MANHGVVRTDNLYGTDVREGLVSVEYLGANGSTPTEIDNGNVLKLNGLKTGEREVFVGAAPAADDAIEDVVLVASPEVMYDERLHNLDDYTNEAGKICRGYHFHKGGFFAVTKDALDGKASPAVGDVVELKAGTKLNVAATATSGSTVIGKIHAVETTSRYTYYVVLVG